MPDARAKLDDEVVNRAKEFASIALVHVDGHADPLGSAQYNQRKALIECLAPTGASWWS